MSDNEMLWVERYRPHKISDCILPEKTKEQFAQMVSTGTIQNMTLAGGPGMGKTTVARALCEELDYDYIIVNASEDGNIDYLRNQIRQFASTVSMMGGLKVVILDEADYLNSHSTQPALRGFIEEFANNCRFILTCNNPSRIMDAILSRCPVIDFGSTKKELQGMAAAMFARAEEILTENGVTYDKKAIINLIINFAPDWRHILGELQRYSLAGHIDDGINTNLGDVAIGRLVSFLKDKNFKEMRRWVGEYAGDTGRLYRQLYDKLDDVVEAESIPALVLLLGEYMRYHSQVQDHELHLAACFTDIMRLGPKWK